MRRLEPRTPAKTLSVGAQQLVEIARALVSNARVLVFDEPTSSLPQRDVARLFEVIGRLRGAGLGIVYISHFLEEVRQICDDYAVLRDGQTAGSGRLASVSDREIVSLMVGRSVDQLFPRVPHTVGEPVLTLRGVSRNRSSASSQSGSASRRDPGDCWTGRCWPNGIAALRLWPRGRTERGNPRRRKSSADHRPDGVFARGLAWFPRTEREKDSHSLSRSATTSP